MESRIGTGRLSGIGGQDHALFAYGTLQFPEVLKVLLGRVPSLEPAELTGWRAAVLPRRLYPGLVLAPGELTHGAVLAGLSAAEWMVLDAFEDDEYDLRRVRVGDRVEPVWTYVWTAATDSAEWRRDRFAADHLAAFASRSARWRRAPGLSSDPGTPVWLDSAEGPAVCGPAGAGRVGLPFQDDRSYIPCMARPRRSADTRQLLVEEGAAGFLMNGYHGTGIKQILDKVGVPKGSFYNYFDSKESFGLAIIEHHSLCVQRNLGEAFDASPDPVSGLRTFFGRLIDDFAAAEFTGGCLIANLGGELEGSELLRESLSEAWGAWRDRVADQLAQGQRLGMIRSDIAATELADMLLESWEGAVIRMKIDRTLAPLGKCLDRLLGDYFRP
ncbi:TetR family transcriptional regulator C-terminal domain-containing protein [Nocardia sp. NPDC023852]|uniref:gamma-glutamylcyclotransferase n=1 Tax=Nocardia sp. NPDC023852 TaxID=3154697 RepID=UPI0033D06E11